MIKKRTFLNLIMVVESAGNNMAYLAADAADTKNGRAAARYEAAKTKFYDALEALREAIQGLDIP